MPFLRNGWEEHTLFIYNTGKGFSLSFDPVFRLTWLDAEVEPDALQVEWHYDHQVQSDLHGLYHLQPALSIFNPLNQYGFWKSGQRDSYQDVLEMLHIFNSPAIFEDTAIGLSGRLIDLAPSGSRLARVRRRMRAQIPAGTLSLEDPTL